MSDRLNTTTQRLDAAAERLVVDVDGSSIACRSWGRGSPVVLVHGASGSWTHWVRNIEPLSEQHLVIAPDLPGFGSSEALPGKPGVDDLAAALVTTIDTVVPEEDTVDIVGFSFGGIVSGLATARIADQGDRVGRLVLVSAGGIGLTGRVPPATGSGPRAELVRFMFANADRADDEALQIHLDNIDRTRFKSGSIPSSNVLAEALPDVPCEVHAVYSDRDAFGGAEPNDRFDRIRAARPETTCHTVTDAGHWSPYEASDQINGLLSALLTPSGA